MNAVNHRVRRGRTNLNQFILHLTGSDFHYNCHLKSLKRSLRTWLCFGLILYHLNLCKCLHCKTSTLSTTVMFSSIRITFLILILIQYNVNIVNCHFPVFQNQISINSRLAHSFHSWKPICLVTDSKQHQTLVLFINE